MAQLKEGSIIKKSTGDEVIATIEDIPVNISELINDIGYITVNEMPSGVQIGGTKPTDGSMWYEEI